LSIWWTLLILTSRKSSFLVFIKKIFLKILKNNVWFWHRPTIPNARGHSNNTWHFFWHIFDTFFTYVSFSNTGTTPRSPLLWCHVLFEWPPYNIAFTVKLCPWRHMVTGLPFDLLKNVFSKKNKNCFGQLTISDISNFFQ